MDSPKPPSKSVEARTPRQPPKGGPTSESLAQHCDRFHRAVFNGGRDVTLHFKPAGKLTLEDAFEVYRGGHSARGLEALGELFETLWRYLGDDDFMAMVEDYITSHPSRFRNLSDWGEEFPAFVDSKTQDLVAVELAKLEWIRHQVFHGPSESISIEGFSPLKYQKNYVLFRTPVKILQLWNAIYESQPVENLDQAQILLVTQQKNQCEMYLVDEATAQIVEALDKFEGDLEKALDWWGQTAPQPLSESQVQESLMTLRQIEWIHESIEPLLCD